MIVDTDFSISETTGPDGTTVVTIGGEADVVTAPQIRDVLFDVAERCGAVVIDLAPLSFIDSTALGVLIVARKRLDDLGKELLLVGLRPHVRKVFDITGLTEVFAIADADDQGAPDPSGAG